MIFLEFNRTFPTEKAAIDYFLHVRYNDTLTCPHCGAKVKVYRHRKQAKACHRKNCNCSFSLFSGTIFEKSATSLVSRHDYICGFRAHPRYAGTGLYTPIPQRHHGTLAGFPKITAQAVIPIPCAVSYLERVPSRGNSTLSLVSGY
jgi:hypothetical protein